ncbi:response regulator [Pyxidicoccus trucidator]|uniref:response regulator n=1 Tax=Pyxidicoccus trucidator TaxID=2709662 RepID=UPI001967CDB7|nr:response regulator [Pyxidicoccus trucidator]
MPETTSPRPSSAQVSILLVDDLPANLFALECILAPTGYRLVRAASGQEALRRVLDEDFAAILLDLRLGDMTGAEVLSLLRERERSRRIPVMLLSGVDGDDPGLQAAFARGAVDYLRKPLDSEVLRAKVALLVELSQTREALRRQEQRVRELTSQLQEARRELQSSKGLPPE